MSVPSGEPNLGLDVWSACLEEHERQGKAGVWYVSVEKLRALVEAAAKAQELVGERDQLQRLVDDQAVRLDERWVMLDEADARLVAMRERKEVAEGERDQLRQALALVLPYIEDDYDTTDNEDLIRCIDEARAALSASPAPPGQTNEQLRQENELLRADVGVLVESLDDAWWVDAAAALGRLKALVASRPGQGEETCSDCDGSGVGGHGGYCPVCGGTGQEEEPDREGALLGHWLTCSCGEPRSGPPCGQGGEA